jgi:hypothetical protein
MGSIDRLVGPAVGESARKRHIRDAHVAVDSSVRAAGGFPTQGGGAREVARAGRAQTSATGTGVVGPGTVGARAVEAAG